MGLSHSWDRYSLLTRVLRISTCENKKSSFLILHINSISNVKTFGFFSFENFSTLTYTLDLILFQNSLYNHEYKIQPSNLFQFSSNVNPSGRVYVYTKPRGPLMGGKSYCNSRGRNSQQNFIGLAETNVKKANDFTAMETIFAISDNPASEEYGTTCFGQDVAAYTEIVTVMVGNTIFLKHFFVGFSFSFHWNYISYFWLLRNG